MTLIGHCCICEHPIDGSQVYLDFGYNYTPHGSGLRATRIEGENDVRLVACAVCETEAMRRYPPQEIVWDAGDGPVKMKLWPMRIYPPVWSVIEVEPYSPNLVDMRTKSGQKLFERNFGKREKMKQVRRDQARELRRRRP